MNEILGHTNSINKTSAHTLSFHRASYDSQHILILSNNIFRNHHLYVMSCCYIFILITIVVRKPCKIIISNNYFENVCLYKIDVKKSL